METFTDNILAVLLFTDLLLVGMSRLSGCISLVAVQGVLVGLLPLFSPEHVNPRSIVFFVVVCALKGVVFPVVLSRAMRSVNARREVEPFVGFGWSILIGVGILAFSFYQAKQLPIPSALVAGTMVMPAALATILIGIFLIVSRRTAVTQVLGYLVLENGISTFGLATVSGIPLLIELGLLLDVFVAVFVMAIMIYQINREFDHIDADRLSTLKG
ncbi:MAG: hydrogenase [Deltaproteobacteria bacterium]|nr:hydrogenase [Deltaproteobacteria bacterium]